MRAHSPAFLSLCAWFVGCGMSGGNELPTTTVERGEFKVVLAVNGELEAVNSASISAPDLGRTIKVTAIAEEGSRVEVGDVLVEFDKNELLEDLENAENKLEVAQTKIAQAESQLAVRLADLENNVIKAELALERAKMRITESETVPKVERESARIDVQEATLSLDSSRATLAQDKLKAKAELQLLQLEVRQEEQRVDRARSRLDLATIKAENAGLVILPEIWKGGSEGIVQAGDTVWRGSTVMLLPDLSEMKAVTWVHEVDAGAVKAGQSVTLVLDAHPDPSWPAQVSRVADLAVKRNSGSQIKHVKVEASIDERAEVMKPGMTVRAEILVESVPDALSVPQEAVFSEGEERFVYTRSMRGWTRTTVELGTRNDSHVVVSSGLQEGAVVALVDPQRFEAGEGTSAAEVATKSDS